MPTYVYETVPSDGSAPVTFEVQQKMADAPLTVHPDSGVPVKRVMSAPNLGGFARGGPAEVCEAPSMGGCGMGACGMGGCGLGELD